MGLYKTVSEYHLLLFDLNCWILNIFSNIQKRFLVKCFGGEDNIKLIDPHLNCHYFSWPFWWWGILKKSLSRYYLFLQSFHLNMSYIFFLKTSKAFLIIKGSNTCQMQLFLWCFHKTQWKQKKLQYRKSKKIWKYINRPGVAGAVLQSHS